MRQLLAPLACVAIALAGLAAPAAAKQVALVIGNSDYARAPDLRNPGNDARAMAETLRGLGFELVGGGARLNRSRSEMARDLQAFGERLGPGDTALFYYAGHGVGLDGENWLIPTDDQAIEVQEDVPDFALSARNVLRRMQMRGQGVNLLFFDACRDNPLPARTRAAAGPGLTRMNAPYGSLIAYAAAPGKPAIDGSGEHGVFTGALLKHLDDPGLRIEDVLIRTTREVHESTNGAQTPWRESSLTEAVYLGRPQQRGLTMSRPEVQDAETLFWNAIEDSGSAKLYRTYLDRVAKGIFSGRYQDAAQARLAQLDKPRRTVEESAEPPQAPPTDDRAAPSDPDASPPASRPTDNTAESAEQPDAPSTPLPPRRPAQVAATPDTGTTFQRLRINRTITVRERPALSARSLGQLVAGDSIRARVERHAGNWFHITAESGNEGYIFGYPFGEE